MIEELSEEYPSKDRVLAPIRWNFRDLPYGWDMFMENTLDPAHVVVSYIYMNKIDCNIYIHYIHIYIIYLIYTYMIYNGIG